MPDIATASGSTAPGSIATTYFDGLFATSPVMAILRGFPPDETVRKARRAWELGIRVVEVPVESDAAYSAFAAAAQAAAEVGTTIGAGTVYRADQVERVVELGAAFAVAPGFDTDISALCTKIGLPYLPGVASASEIQAAVRAGHTWVKTFPARELGTSWLRAMRGPFPTLKMVATGGIDARNAADFLDAGASVVAVGSAIDDDAQLTRLARLI